MAEAQLIQLSSAPMRLSSQRREWDDLSAMDPLWAILSHDGKRSGGWDLDEFMSSGRAEIAGLLVRASELGRPARRGRALDFGCGAGRLTSSLAEYFDEAVGVDISASMIDQARMLHQAVANCQFVANPRPDLACFDDASFDLVYTRLVLQHIPSADAVLAYVRELVRVMAPDGLLAFQLPTHIPLNHRLQPKPRLYAALRRAGVSRDILYRRLRLHPIRMSFVPFERVETTLREVGARILTVDSHRVTGGLTSSTFFVAHEELR